MLLPRTQAHAIDAPTLGEYAALVLIEGERVANAAFPDVRAHLATGCQRCLQDLSEMRTVLAHELRANEKELP